MIGLYLKVIMNLDIKSLFIFPKWNSKIRGNNISVIASVSDNFLPANNSLCK